jgi:hypothetical protein
LYFLLRPKGGGISKVWYGILGADDRVSTSKVQFALWTLALAFALLVSVFHDAVFPPSQLDPRYLLLIGFPAGAAVGAKVITAGQLKAGSVDKTPQANPTNSVSGAIKDVVSDDSGNLDLGDTQYFLFNIVALVAFFYAFAHNPTALPVLPDTLVALTSASATAYVAKKAGTSSPVSITAVSPQLVKIGDPVTIYGSNLWGTLPNAAQTSVPGNTPVDPPPKKPQVTIGGALATVISEASNSELTVHVGEKTPNSVPAPLPTAPANSPPLPPAQTLSVQVVNLGGQSARLANAIAVAASPNPT